MSAQPRSLGDVSDAGDAGATDASEDARASAQPRPHATLRIRPLDAREQRARRQRHTLPLVALALVVLSLWSAQPLFLLGALLLISLDVVPELWYRYGLRDIRTQRRIGRGSTPLGGDVEVEVSVENRKVLPLPWLEVNDEFPEGLIVLGRPLAPSAHIGRAALRLTLALAAYQRVRRRYRLLAVERGVFHFGPTILRARDPFGLQTAEAELDDPATLIVQPLVTAIERLGLPPVAPFGEHRSSVRLLDDPLRVSGIRDYAPGDEPRRIHWKATARAGTLQSKLYDPSTRHALVICLDLRTWPGVAVAPDAALTELAICAAASVGAWAHEQRYAVGLCANAPIATNWMALQPGLRAPAQRLVDARRLLRLPASASPRQMEALLDGLARLLSFAPAPMDALLDRERPRLPRGATVVYIGADSALDAALLAALRRLRTSGHPVSLLLTQAEASTDAPLPPGALDHLHCHIMGGRALWRSLLREALGDDIVQRLAHGAKPAFITAQRVETGSASGRES